MQEVNEMNTNSPVYDSFGYPPAHCSVTGIRWCSGMITVHSVFYLVIMLILLGVTGCSSMSVSSIDSVSDHGKEKETQMMDSGIVSSLQDSGQLQEYRIQCGDQMEIKFFYNPELNETVVVRPDGRISLPLAQDIPAAGKTPSELTENLRESYARELYRPEISIIMRSFSGQRVYVDGEVNSPSFVLLAADMTVLKSIAEAGGSKDTARLNEVVVIRRAPQGNPKILRLDLSSALGGTDLSQDVVLMPSDIVYVPKTSIANVNRWVTQYLWNNLPIGFGVNF